MRIPIMTSRRSMQRPSPVYPSSAMGTEVSEAIGGLARTVGKVATDWANAKAQDTAQRELASGMVNYKSKMSDYIAEVRDNPEYNPKWEEDFNKFEKETRGGIEFTSQRAKQTAGRNFDNYRISYKTDLANVDRQKYQQAGKIQLNTDLDTAEKMRDKKQVNTLLGSANLLLSAPAIKAEKIKRYHNIEMLQIRDALTLDPNADLSGFKNVSNKEKSEIVSAIRSNARAEANRLKAERKENEKIYFEQTNDTFDEAFRKNELTMPEVNNSILPTKGEGGKIWWRKKLTTSPASESDISVVKDIRRKRAIGTLTLVDIDSKQDKLTRADYIRFSSEKKKRQKEIIDGKYIPSVFEEKSYMFMDELDRLVDNGTVTDKEAEEAKLKLPEQLYDRAMKEGFTEKQITDYSEFLIGSYLLKESQIRRDASAFKKFMSFMGSNVQGLIRESRREKRVEALPTEADFPTEEIEEEAIEIKDITPENVAHLSDWLKKNKKLVNEKNIRYLYEQLK